jgi:hypothetical protein
MNNREQLVADHSAAMLTALNLPKNQAKGDDWLTADPQRLLDLLNQEVRELEAVVWQWYHGGSPAKVRSEAADVSNFAAMIADRCKEHKTKPMIAKNRCPECGGYLLFASGCQHCPCGFSRCG